MREAHNLIGALLSLIGVLFVDWGQSHNPMERLFFVNSFKLFIFKLLIKEL